MATKKYSTSILTKLYDLSKGTDGSKFEEYENFVKKHFGGYISPHIKDSLKRSKTSSEFLKNVKKFSESKINEAGMGLHLMKTPRGNWHFVGSVPIKLAYTEKDGSPLKPETERDLPGSSNPGMMASTRVFKTSVDALKAAQKLGISKSKIQIKEGNSKNKMKMSELKSIIREEMNRILLYEYDEWRNTKIQAKNIFRMLEQKYDNISDRKTALDDILKQNKTKDDQSKIIWKEFNKYFESKKDKKLWDDMTDKEKRFVYKKAIESGDVKDSFDGFSKMMTSKGKGEWKGKNLFNVKTGKPVEINW